LIEEGEMFGHSDLINSKAYIEYERNIKRKGNNALKKKLIPRHFTMRAVMTCDLMTLPLEELTEMKNRFPDVFLELL